jgi:hypothetical protein
VSKFKTPREKKLASLALDRRNVYGENDKSSRKNIPLSKQHSNQVLRRAANQPLQGLTGSVEEDAANQAESDVRTAVIAKKRRGFKKSPDAPLGVFLERQKYWAGRRESDNDYRKAKLSPDEVGQA